jgi:hypothetical protein
MSEAKTDIYFTDANTVEEFSNGIIVQASKTDTSEWEPWEPYEEGEEPSEQKKSWGKAKLYKGRWHYCGGVMPRWFAKNTVTA